MGAAPIVRIHRNLHNAKRGGPQWSRTERGKVVEYLKSVALREVSTRVRQGGVRRCQSRGVREVCAFFDGERIDPNQLPKSEPEAVVRFDPRVDSQFYAAGFDMPGSRFPFARADFIALTDDGRAYVWGAK